MLHNIATASLLYVLVAVSARNYPPEAPQFTFHGRHYFQDGLMKYDYACFKIDFCFNATRIDWNLIDTWNSYQLSIDDKVVNKKIKPSKNTTITLFNSSKPEYHCAELIKTTQNHYGPLKSRKDSVFKGMQVQGGQLFKKQHSYNYTLEFYGDSLSTAFGVYGSNKSLLCLIHMVPDSNCVEGWPHLLSKKLNADYRLDSVSGTGMVKNSLPVPGPALPSLYSRITDNSKVNSYYYQDGFAPDAIFVFIGINDYLNFVHPSVKHFSWVYRQFLEELLRKVIRSTGKKTKIINICGKDEPTKLCQSVQRAVREFNYEYDQSYYVEIPEGVLFQKETDGCFGHPNPQGHLNLANALYEPVKKILDS